MLDKFKKKLANTMGRTVREVTEPIKNNMKQVADNKVDLYSKILRLGVLVLLFIEGTKRVSNDSNRDQLSPNQIVINNYIGEKKVND